MGIGELRRDYLRVFVPIALTIFGFFLYNITDTYFISLLGEDQLSGVGLMSPLMAFAMIFMSTLGGAVSIHISKAFGGGLVNRIRKKILVGSVLNVSVALAVFLFAMCLSDAILGLYDVSAPILQSFSDYYRWWVYTLLADALIVSYSYALNSMGRTSETTRVNLYAVLANIALDMALIFGVGSFVPAMGVEGASLATLLVKIAQAAAFFFMLKKSSLLVFSLRASDFAVLARRIAGLAVPMGAQGFIVPVSTFLFSLLVARQAEFEIAAWSTFMRIEQLIFVIAGAAAATIGILMSQYNGKKRYADIPFILVFSNRVVMSWKGALFLAVVFFGKEIGSIFLDNPQSIEAFHTSSVLGFGAYLFSVVLWNINRTFIALGKAYLGLRITVVRNALGIVVLPWALEPWLGYTGLFVGFLLGAMLALGYSIALYRRHLMPIEKMGFGSLWRY